MGTPDETPAPDDEELLFEAESAFPEQDADSAPPWKILVVDDDPEVHAISRLVLRELGFKGRSLRFLSGHSAGEAHALIEQHPDIALVLLDVIMETESAGLDLIRHIREERLNRAMQIILRTGQPGLVPESRVIRDYEINDYKEKTELTAQKLTTAVLAALRAYDFATQLEEKRKALEQVIAACSRFVPSQSLALLGKADLVHLGLGDQKQGDMAVMFLDIRGFTQLCEPLTPGQIFEFLNALLGRLSPVIRQHGGHVDSYLGDGLLALFPGSADDAVAAIFGLRDCLRHFNLGHSRPLENPVRIGVGVHYGSLLLGIVGEPERWQATVLSDIVNTCSRIESLTKEYRVDALISEDAIDNLQNPGKHRFRYVDTVRLRGKTRSTDLYELLDEAPDAAMCLKAETRAEFEEGLALYRACRFPESTVLFSRVLARNPQDEVARLYLKRAADYMVNGAPADWRA
jgi:class 3 adenylate cyclase